MWQKQMLWFTLCLYRNQRCDLRERGDELCFSFLAFPFIHMKLPFVDSLRLETMKLVFKNLGFAV